MINRIDHIGIAVKDADKALEVYQNVFGLEVDEVQVSEEDGIKTVSLKAGETKIELYQPISHKSSIAAFISQRGEGLHHLCFEVDNLKTARETIKKKGLGFLKIKSGKETRGREVAFLNPYGTHRVLVELKEKS